MHIIQGEALYMMRKAGNILSQVHGILAEEVQEGVTTKHLDEIAFEAIRDMRAKPAFRGYQGFPASLCVSVNDEVVHGIPGDYVLQSGDIVSIDCGVVYQGYYADSAFTHKIGDLPKELLTLLLATEEALCEGIEQVRLHHTIGDIGHAIAAVADKYKLGIVKEYTGHAIGSKLHGEPIVPNYGVRGQGAVLPEGIALAIEPIFTVGDPALRHEGEWCAKTVSKQAAAHFEHTVVMVDGKPECMTTFEYIRGNK